MFESQEGGFTLFCCLHPMPSGMEDGRDGHLSSVEGDGVGRWGLDKDSVMVR